MDTEFEATFKDIDKNEVRKILLSVGAKLIQKEHLLKRVVFKLPEGHEIPGGWLRVRDEGDKITMSLKVVDGDRIEDQKEIYLVVEDFKKAQLFLTTIGCVKKADQESKRELWLLEDVEITIDEWPFLEPFVEIEGKSKKKVKEISEKLGFDYGKALFCAVDKLYSLKYGIPEEVIDKAPKIIFNSKNPFLSK